MVTVLVVGGIITGGAWLTSLLFEDKEPKDHERPPNRRPRTEVDSDIDEEEDTDSLRRPRSATNPGKPMGSVISSPQCQRCGRAHSAKPCQALRHANGTYLGPAWTGPDFSRPNAKRAGAGIPGQAGLRNLGNTCFINATLQCLAHTLPLAEFFSSDALLEEIDKSRTTTGRFSLSFREVLRELHLSCGSPVSPSSFRSLVGTWSSTFAGSSQQDAHEFLRFLLDRLHEELKRPGPAAAEFKEYPNEPEHMRADRSWNYFCQRNDSFIWKLFCGQLRSEVRCSGCRAVSRTYDPFMDLSLELSYNSARQCTLLGCLQHFQQSERLSGANAWNCPSCRRACEATKRLSVSRWPPVLVVHLKRFANHLRKLPDAVSFPEILEVNELDRQVLGVPGDEEVYSLFGVIHHLGSTSAGHYLAYCMVEGCWYEFDDSTVSPVGPLQVNDCGAYVLFYQRVPSISA
eukprot:TRINITY_DN93342_c0_g1_i1.p1 TRINITY_DN93342_c0_g1~~TRINITY_DN93342_c0_g1_i1.p1  ORF type:complete len:459 (-),score=15.52 TRINITY_DN93342_c0_g1_i1:16-1392(-)